MKLTELSWLAVTVVGLSELPINSRSSSGASALLRLYGNWLILFTYTPSEFDLSNEKVQNVRLAG